jgi:hypothetical protein
MGYDCTLHVVDEGMIRERLVPRLLGRAGERSPFDDAPDAAELWAKVRAALRQLDRGEEPPETVANLICQLAIVYCAAELPYHYERGFCLSLWPDQPREIAARVPREFLGDPETLFAEVVAEHPALRGRFPAEIESNYCPGCFVPEERVPGLLAWVERRVRGYPKPERRRFRGLILVLKQAAERGLAYWEGTELPVRRMETIMPPAERRRADLEEIPSPGGIYLKCVGRADATVVFAHGTGFPRDCRTAFADLSTWPPRFTFADEYALRAARSGQGRWVTASMTSDRPYLYRVRVSDRPDGPRTLLLPPDERENGIHWADFLGERVIAVLSAKVVYPAKTLLPAYPVWERDGCLVPVEGLRPSPHESPTFGVVHLNDGGEIFVWDGEGYELQDGRFEHAFRLGAKWSLDGSSPVKDFGPDGFFFLSNRELYGVRRGQSPVRHLPGLGNIMSISAGPTGALLLQEGDNKLGDLGKLYFPDEGVYVRIEPELFEDADPNQIHSLHWAGSCGRLVAATPSRLWAVPVESVLGLPRFRASDGKQIRRPD